MVKNCLDSQKYITFQWIPGHVGIKHNETIDTLAKSATANGIEVKDIILPISDFKDYQKQRFQEKKNNILQTSAKARWYKEVQGSSPTYPWDQNMKTGRWEIINITKLRIGHVNLNKMLHRLNLYFTPLCLKCTTGAIESVEHLILECPQYDYARTTYFRKIKKLSNDNNTEKIRKIHSSLDLEVYQEINSFFATIKRNI